MSYIDKNLMPGEVVKFRTKKNFMIFFFPFVWTIFSAYASDYMYANPVLVKLTWTPWVLAFVFWSYVWLEYITSEFAVTNKRVMMREGFFYRHSNETRLSAISQVNVDQSLLGRMLDYGTVSINAFGAFDFFPMLAKPFQFQQSVNEQMDKAVSAN